MDQVSVSSVEITEFLNAAIRSYYGTLPLKDPQILPFNFRLLAYIIRDGQQLEQFILDFGSLKRFPGYLFTFHSPDKLLVQASEVYNLAVQPSRFSHRNSLPLRLHHQYHPLYANTNTC